MSDLSIVWTRITHVDDVNACWEWSGHRDRDGYGLIRIGGRPWRAHRAAYFDATGVDPGHLKVLHSCDNPPCCNPGHLSLGTQADNVADMTQKGRSTRGQRHPGAKLTADQVREIRNRRSQGERVIDLAEEFAMSKQQISAIALNRFWAHAS